MILLTRAFWIVAFAICLSEVAHGQDNDVALKDLLIRVSNALSNFTDATKNSSLVFQNDVNDFRKMAAEIKKALENKDCDNILPSRLTTTDLWHSTSSYDESTSWHTTKVLWPSTSGYDDYEYTTSHYRPSTPWYDYSTSLSQIRPSSSEYDEYSSWYMTSKIRPSSSWYQSASWWGTTSHYRPSSSWYDDSISWYTASQTRPYTSAYEYSSWYMTSNIRPSSSRYDEDSSSWYTSTYVKPSTTFYDGSTSNFDSSASSYALLSTPVIESSTRWLDHSSSNQFRSASVDTASASSQMDYYSSNINLFSSDFADSSSRDYPITSPSYYASSTAHLSSSFDQPSSSNTIRFSFHSEQLSSIYQELSSSFDYSSSTFSQSGSGFDLSTSKFELPSSTTQPLSSGIYQSTSSIQPSVTNSQIEISSSSSWTLSTPIIELTTASPPTATDCADWYTTYRQRTNGLYWIKPKGSNRFMEVYCDMETDGGGWTVIQRHHRPIANRRHFHRKWYEYKNGFGDLSGQFWLGNDNIHTLTAVEFPKLRIDMKNSNGQERYASYNRFYIEDEASKYRLHIGSYFGTAGDSLRIHDNMPFTTHDVDNDRHATINCAELVGSGWWYGACMNANPNDLTWGHWNYPGAFITEMEMKIRPY